MVVINDDRPMPGADPTSLFSSPETNLNDDLPSYPIGPSTSSRRGDGGSPDGNGNPRPDQPDDTLTGTFPTSPRPPRGDSSTAAKTALAILGVIVLVADALIVRSVGRRLRRPSKQQLRDFAGPAGNMIHRHGVGAVLGDDVADIVGMAGAVSDWLLEGPLTTSGPRVEYADDDQAPPAPPPPSAPTPAPAAAAPPQNRSVRFLE